MKKGYLVLESGEIFEGFMVGADKSIDGEVVFNTSMTGYQEMMTDPSYTGQILTFCYPLIGNYGINPVDDESDKIAPSGVIISDLCLTPSHYLSIETFGEHLKKAGIPCLAGIDTRALVKRIREKGTIRGVISAQASGNKFPKVDSHLVAKVSIKKIEHYGHSGPHIVLVDFGHKKSIAGALIDEGCQVTIVPYNTTFEEVKKLEPDGVVFSNGPGDPLTLEPLFSDVKKISDTFPTLGICLGHQLIALANGARTEKLLFGHRGSNHPVKDLETGSVWLTAQNHSYVVADESINTDLFEVSYRNVNDGSIEGLKHRKLPIETVQFHPEAHPGPTDTYHIFKRFLKTIQQHAGEVDYATTN